MPLYLKLYADAAPYACENFLRLLGKPVEEGGYLGSAIHDIKPGVYVKGGKVSAGKKRGTNTSSFAGGRPFENECDEDAERGHGAWSISMVSGNGLKEGLFGSQFSICACDSGSVKAALLDRDEGSLVIGKVVDGQPLFQVLDSLMGSQQWLDIQAQGGSKTKPVELFCALRNC